VCVCVSVCMCYLSFSLCCHRRPATLVFVHVCVRACLRVCMFVYVHVNACACLCTCMFMCVCVCVFVYVSPIGQLAAQPLAPCIQDWFDTDKVFRQTPIGTTRNQYS